MPWNGDNPSSDSSDIELFVGGGEGYEMVSSDASRSPLSSPCTSGSLLSLGCPITGALIVKLVLFVFHSFQPASQSPPLAPACPAAPRLTQHSCGWNPGSVVRLLVLQSPHPHSPSCVLMRKSVHLFEPQTPRGLRVKTVILHKLLSTVPSTS